MSDSAAVPPQKRLYMIVEHFKNHDPAPVYQRFREHGRMLPEGLVYVSSWVDDKRERCFQLMETADPALIDQWIVNWSDLVDFEVYPVLPSQPSLWNACAPPAP